MNEPPQANRPMRADAQRNYASLLNAARVAISERGADIVLEDVARSAGVAIGTLYRHFPTRQDLLEAVFLDEANELRVHVEKLTSAPVPFDALISWLRLQMDFRGSGAEHGSSHHGCQARSGDENLCSEQSDARGGKCSVAPRPDRRTNPHGCPSCRRDTTCLRNRHNKRTCV